MTNVKRVRPTRFAVRRLAHLIAAAMVPSVALAQTEPPIAASKEAAAEDGQATSRVVVSAQRRLQAMNEVPIAISVLSSEELSKRGATDLQALVGAVPSLSISGSSGLNASNLVAIRGLSGQAIPIGSSTPVAIYLDGEYLPRPDTAFFTLDDVQSIEVLRGPQGTLYGRNSTAGAINIITRTPGNTLKGGGEVSFGNFNQRAMKGSLTGPLGGGFSAGISASQDERDGYFTNGVTGNNMAPYKAYTVRGKLRYESPDGNFVGQLSLDKSSVEGQQAAFQNVYGGPSGPFFALPGGSVPVYIGVGNPWVVEHDAASEQRTFSKNQSQGGSLTLTYRPSSEIELTSVTTARDWSVDQAYDLDNTAAPILFTRSSNSSRTFMQELRAVVTAGRSVITAGANYYKEDQELGLPPFGSPTLSPPLTNPYVTSALKAVGVFAQYEYELTKTLGINAGVRWNQETRDFANDYTRATNAAGTPTPGPYLSGTIKDSAVIPAMGLNYKFSPDVMAYAKVSRGYQAPGFNPTPGATATKTNQFGAEHLTAYELGVKADLFDRRLSVSAAAFTYDYSDLQVRRLVGVGVIEVQNAASATIRGLELSAAARLGGGFGMSANYSLVSAKYDNYCEPVAAGTPQGSDPLCSAGVADRSGNYLINAPRTQGSLSVDYGAALGSGRINARLSYSASAKAYFSAANEEILSTGGSSKRVDARIGYQLQNGPEIYVYGKNLTNDWNNDMALRASPTFALVHVTAPRTFGAGLRYRF